MAVGQVVSDTGVTFLPCAISHRAAEKVVASLRKGVRVMVTGVLRQRTWHTVEGDERYAYEVAATEVGASLNRATLRLSDRSGDDNRPC
jgi:single-strand DNA-binding protein